MAMGHIGQSKPTICPDSRYCYSAALGNLTDYDTRPALVLSAKPCVWGYRFCANKGGNVPTLWHIPSLEAGLIDFRIDIVRLWKINLQSYRVFCVSETAQN
jgi:hypothetical protein